MFLARENKVMTSVSSLLAQKAGSFCCTTRDSDCASPFCLLTEGKRFLTLDHRFVIAAVR